MKSLTTAGRERIEAIASKYDLKSQTVEDLAAAIAQGNGTMAQFNIAELGGSGQWMKGGMTMVGDMFNNSLRSTVDKLCNELSELVGTQVIFEDGAEADNSGHAGSGTMDSGNTQRSSERTWPSVFGNPTASGSQNNFRYAYFPLVRRLVIDEDGKRTIYDTKHHQITGISQQQGSGNSYRFTSQDGTVDLASLTVVSEPAGPSQPTPQIAYDVTATADLRINDAPSPQDTIVATIEKINMLFERGQITEEEFNAKKKELLERL